MRQGGSVGPPSQRRKLNGTSAKTVTTKQQSGGTALQLLWPYTGSGLRRLSNVTFTVLWNAQKPPLIRICTGLPSVQNSIVA